MTAKTKSNRPTLRNAKDRVVPIIRKLKRQYPAARCTLDHSLVRFASF